MSPAGGVQSTDFSRVSFDFELEPVPLWADFEYSIIGIARRRYSHQWPKQRGRFVEGEEQVRISRRVRQRIAIGQVESVNAVSFFSG